MCLNDVASLANLVTVVDAASVFEQLSTMDTLVDRGWHEAEGDKRTVSHLLCDQNEFADLLLINKSDLVSAISRVSPHAHLMRISSRASHAHLLTRISCASAHAHLTRISSRASHDHLR